MGKARALRSAQMPSVSTDARNREQCAIIGTGRKARREDAVLGTGERIRKARRTAGMTQQQLADAIGKTKSAIANYEKGDRTPDEATITGIASALGILPESLKDRELNTVADVLDALLTMEEAGFGVEPVETKNGVVIAVDPNAPHAPKMAMALEKWNEQRKALKGGDISQVEYALWRGDFGGIDEDEAGEMR